MRLRCGTMGFGYSDWSGVFYPEHLKQGEFLSHYARHFDTVELDTTYHATPPLERVEKWARMTPVDFVFCPKASKAVTHEGALGRRIGEMKQFVEVMRGFGHKLGVVLIQLPPSCGIEQFEGLEQLLRSLPRDVRFAVEFRNVAWGQQRTLDLLRENGCGLVMAEYLTLPRRILLTADFTYIRLIGEHERFSEYQHEQIDMGESLAWWKEELERVGPQVQEAFVLFNNDYSGYAIETARRFMRMMGQPVVEIPPEQGRLFG